MRTHGYARVVRTEDGFDIRTEGTIALPPGYTLRIEGLLDPTQETQRLPYVIEPASGLHARWLRWRYPVTSTT